MRKTEFRTAQTRQVSPHRHILSGLDCKTACEHLPNWRIGCRSDQSSQNHQGAFVRGQRVSHRQPGYGSLSLVFAKPESWHFILFKLCILLLSAGTRITKDNSCVNPVGRQPLGCSPSRNSFYLSRQAGSLFLSMM